MSDSVYLKHTRYGKDLVRLLRVYKEGNVQHCTELTVRLMLEGDIETSYTKADNSVVVATDTCKNTIHIIAKRSPNVDNIEVFATEITEHVLNQYAHISGAFVDIIKHRWTRLIVDDKPHPHSFLRDGEDVQTAQVVHLRHGNQVTITSGLDKLLVLKTTGSAFHGFYRDEYTTLQDTYDRIFSTAVDCKWKFTSNDLNTLRKIDFKNIHAGVRQITCDTFAKDESASVQATLYLMQQLVLKKYSVISEISYALPNKHYFSIDMGKLNINNLGKDAEVYYPMPDPSGLITATAGRKTSKL